MSSSLPAAIHILALGLLTASCDRGAESGEAKSAAASKTEAAKPAKPDPATQAEPSGDPKLLAICRAYDEVVAEGTAATVVLQTAAVRAVEKHGLTEGELSNYGASPAALLKSIRDGGEPAGCNALATALKTMSESPDSR